MDEWGLLGPGSDWTEDRTQGGYPNHLLSKQHPPPKLQRRAGPESHTQYLVPMSRVQAKSLASHLQGLAC